jgi:hypothetical protein
MTHDDFVQELAERLNSFIKRVPQHALATLSMPLPMVGFASVAQVFGVVSMPGASNPEHLFLMPKVNAEGQLEGFECISGVELANRMNSAETNRVEQENGDDHDRNDTQ